MPTSKHSCLMLEFVNDVRATMYVISCCCSLEATLLRACLMASCYFSSSIRQLILLWTFFFSFCLFSSLLWLIEFYIASLIVLICFLSNHFFGDYELRFDCLELCYLARLSIFLDASTPPITGICKSMKINLYALSGHLHGLANALSYICRAINPLLASSIPSWKFSWRSIFTGMILKAVSSTTSILGLQSHCFYCGAAETFSSSTYYYYYYFTYF